MQEAIRKAPKLARTLTLFDIILMGLGATIGAGVFVVTGRAACEYAGPAISLSYLLASLVLSVVAFSYAELSSKIPLSGGIYSYAYVSFGEFTAWILGCLMFLTYISCISAAAIGFSKYIISFLQDNGFNIPGYFTVGYGQISHGGDVGFVNMPAIIIILLCTYVLTRNLSIYSRFNALIVSVKIMVLALFVILGLYNLDVSLWIPFIPTNCGVFGQFGYSGIIGGVAVSTLAFIGFESVAAAAQEAKDPEKDVPRGILLSLAISGFIYSVVALVLTGVMHYSELGVVHSMALAIQKISPPLVSSMIILGVSLGLSTVVLVVTYSLSRLMLNMVNDGLLPQFFNYIHPINNTPNRLIYLISFITIFNVNLLPVDQIVDLSNLSVLIVFIFACIINIYIRYSSKYAHITSDVQCPIMPALPIAAIISLLLIISTLSSTIFTYVFYYLIIVTIIYILYSRLNSNYSEEG